MKTKLFVLTGLLAVSASAFAQEQPNSAQYHAVHNPNSPYYTGANQQPAAPPVRWADRWGAIAVDDNAVFGIVTDMSSKHQAQEAAIAECKKRGGRECKVQLAYYNQCAAVAAGNSVSRTSTRAHKEEAIAAAISNCEAVDGQGVCRVYYSGCSLPVQVQ